MSTRGLQQKILSCRQPDREWKAVGILAFPSQKGELVTQDSVKKGAGGKRCINFPLERQSTALMSWSQCSAEAKSQIPCTSCIPQFTATVVLPIQVQCCYTRCSETKLKQSRFQKVLNLRNKAVRKIFIGMEIEYKYKQRAQSEYFLETRSGKVVVRN